MQKRSTRNLEEEDRKPQVSPEIGIKLLQQQIDEAKKLVSKRPIDGPLYFAWFDATRTYLNKAFGKYVKSIDSQVTMISNPYINISKQQRDIIDEKDHFESLNKLIVKLEGFVKQLQTEIEISEISQKKPELRISEKDNIMNSEVFIVHGHNENTKIKVARFLEKAGLKPIILHEQPAKGRTLIEKLIAHSLVGYAIILLTADDLGKSVEEADFKPRARQNVIFEMGYFCALLGRARLSILCEEGIEIQSDYLGVEYLPLTKNGVWQSKLLSELSAAGFVVDYENALKSI